MQGFVEFYSDIIFGIDYIILGIVTIVLFSKNLCEIKRNKKDGLSNQIIVFCSIWIVIGIVWICLGVWNLCEQIDFNSKPENVLKQIEYNKPECMKFYIEENAPISCLQEYTAWKVRYDKQKNYIDSLRQVNIKILNEN